MLHLALTLILSISAGFGPPDRTDGAIPPDAPAPTGLDDVRVGLLTPIPDRGAVPPIAAMLDSPSREQLEMRARSRAYARELSALAHECFRSRRAPTRAAGLERLREFTDPAAFEPMIEVLSDAGPDVQAALLDHFEAQGGDGQAALAWMSIHHDSDVLRSAALSRLDAPASPATLRVLDAALRSNTHDIANRAGLASNVLNAAQTIPLLIFAQATVDPREQTGDLAWIAIETQHTFVAGLQAVVGNNSAAYQPILGIVSDGTLLRVMDAVVVVYRTEIHGALVRMTSDTWGRPTEQFGYDMNRWWHWYNEEYVPSMNAQVRSEPEPAPERRLFDGASLAGWHARGGGHWTVEDGAIVGRSSKSETAHGLLCTDSTYDDFEMTFEYRRFEGNSGFYFRSEERDDAVGVMGFQVEVDSAAPGGLYEANGRGWVVKPSPEDVQGYHKPGDWNRVVLRAVGDEIRVTVNGVVVVEIRDAQGRRFGRFALQLHGGEDMHVRFRGLRLREM